MKTHPRQSAGGRSTDPADLPPDKTGYAMRDLDYLQRLAAGHGPAIGAYAAVLLEHPLPWTKMRQVYALLGLVTKWGPDRVEAACARAAAAEAFSVALIGRMLARGLETDPAPTQTSLFPPPPVSTTSPTSTMPASRPARFARPSSHFTARRPTTQTGGENGGAA